MVPANAKRREPLTPWKCHQSDQADRNHDTKWRVSRLRPAEVADKKQNACLAFCVSLLPNSSAITGGRWTDASTATAPKSPRVAEAEKLDQITTAPFVPKADRRAELDFAGFATTETLRAELRLLSFQRTERDQAGEDPGA